MLSAWSIHRKKRFVFTSTATRPAKSTFPSDPVAVDIPAIHYWRMGGGGGGSIFNDFLNGESDDLRIYNVALTDDDVAAIYNSGMGDVNVPQAAYVSQMIFDEGDSINGLGVKLRQRHPLRYKSKREQIILKPRMLRASPTTTGTTLRSPLEIPPRPSSCTSMVSKAAALNSFHQPPYPHTAKVLL